MLPILTFARPLTIECGAIKQIMGKPMFEAVALEGKEGLNHLFTYHLIVQTRDNLRLTDRHLSSADLDQLLFKPITCRIETESATPRYINALIEKTHFVSETNRHRLYQLTLRPWLHLAQKTTHCRVFQDMSAVQIVEEVLGSYSFRFDKRLIETYPPRDYTIQHN